MSKDIDSRIRQLKKDIADPYIQDKWVEREELNKLQKIQREKSKEK